MFGGNNRGLSPISAKGPSDTQRAVGNVLLGGATVGAAVLFGEAAIPAVVAALRGCANNLAQCANTVGDFALAMTGALPTGLGLSQAERAVVAGGKAGANTTAELTGAETAGSIRNVNPGYPTVGRTQNCVNCTVSADATLSGNPAVALPSSGPVPISVLEQQYGGRFGSATTADALAQQMLDAGNGSRGIVFGSRGPGQAGHVFNVVNQNGVVRFLDGQTGAPATFNGYTSFHLLKTN